MTMLINNLLTEIENIIFKGSYYVTKIFKMAPKMFGLGTGKGWEEMEISNVIETYQVIQCFISIDILHSAIP